MPIETRWYDETTVISQAIWAWEHFPYGIRILIAKHVTAEIQEYRRLVRLNSGHDMPRLPAKRLLGLYKSAVKRRWYDKYPAIRRAINSLALVDQSLLLRLSGQILKIDQFLREKADQADFLTQQDLEKAIQRILLAYSSRIELN